MSNLFSSIVFLLSLQSGSDLQIEFEPPTDHGGYFSFAFSPDGKLVAGGTGIVKVTLGSSTSRKGGDVILWDARTGKIKKQFQGHDATVGWLAWSADSKVLVTMSNDNRRVKAWKPTGRSARKSFELPSACASRNPPALSSDGELLAVVGEKSGERNGIPFRSPGTLQVWSVDRAKAVFEEADSDVTRLSFSPEGSFLATQVRRRDASGRSTEVFLELRSMPSGESVWTNDSLEKEVQCMAWSEDGKKLVAAGPSTLWMLDADSGEVVTEFDIKAEHSPAVVALDRKARKIAIARFMGREIDVWDLASGSRLGRRDFEFPNNFWHPGFDADLGRMACKHGHVPGILDITGLVK